MGPGSDHDACFGTCDDMGASARRSLGVVCVAVADLLCGFRILDPANRSVCLACAVLRAAAQSRERWPSVDVWRITLAAVRRWYILLPVLALTGWGVMVAGNGIDPEYEVQATVMLTPGTTVSEVPNPYGSIDDANQAVGIVLNSTEAHAQIAAQGLSTDYTVSPETRSTIMHFTVRADTPQVAISTGAALIDLAESELSTRQGDARVPRSSQYGVAALAPPSVLNVVYDGKLRIQAIVGILGASVGLVLAVLFDDIVGIVKRRRRARRTRALDRDLAEEGARSDAEGDRSGVVKPIEPQAEADESSSPPSPSEDLDRDSRELDESRVSSTLGE